MLYTVMQTALQKIDEHFENMQQRLWGEAPQIPHSPSHKIVYIINQANVVEKKSASSNKDCVAMSEAHQTPLNKRQTLW